MNSQSCAPYINYLKILGLRPIDPTGFKKWEKYLLSGNYNFLHTAYAFVFYNLNLSCNSLLTYFRPATLGRGQVGYKGGQKKNCQQWWSTTIDSIVVQTQYRHVQKTEL